MSAQTDWNRQVEAIFQAALDLPEDQRAAFVIAQTAHDVALTQEVQSLLDSYAAARQSFLENPAHRMSERPGADAHLPESIGRYRILSRIGTGGMGVVYRAEQQNPRREIALKVMRPGITSRAALRRFEMEAALLARLAHPGIAQVFEAGTYVAAGDPRPFFAMELVDGAALMEHVQACRPSTHERLELLASICDAVQFAHQKGIIHRDLKPSNIMVVNVAAGAGNGISGASPRVCPKILDFGVARTTDADIQATTMHTEVGQVLGTLAYMSPEQIAADTRDIDTRSDVYALGVIIYEVLTGRLPIDVSNKTIGAAARMICENEPQSLGAMDRAFRGDLSTIVQKALEKDAARRYASAGELAADLRHYLNDEPIAARRATTLYQFQKFARRNRGLVAGVALALIVLVIGGVISTSLAISRTKALAESERQRDIAQEALVESDRQRDIAQAVNDFLNKDLLGQANPYGGAAHDAKLRDVLDRASEAIEQRLDDQPLVQASIRGTLGRTYYHLGAYDQSNHHLERAIAVYARELGDAHVLTNELRHVQVQSNMQNFKLKEAEALLDIFLKVADEHLGPNHELTAKAYGNLGVLRKRQGNFAASEQAYRHALEIYGRIEKADQRLVAITKENLGLVLFDQDKDAEAELLLREAVGEFERISGVDSADVAYGLTNLGQVYKQSRPKAEGLELALRCFERAYAIRRERLGENHRETLRTRGCQAMALDEMGQHAQGEEMQRDVLERRLKIMEEDHVDVLDSRYYVGEALEHQGRFAEAADMYWQSVRLGQARYGPEYYHVRRFRKGLMKILRDTNEQAGLHVLFTEYLVALEKAALHEKATASDLNAYAYWLMNCDTECLRNDVRALEMAQRAHELAPADHPYVPHTLAQALVQNGRNAEAVEVLRQAIAAQPEHALEPRKALDKHLADIMDLAGG